MKFETTWPEKREIIISSKLAKNGIQKVIEKVKPEDRSEMKYIHIGAVKVLIKALHREW